MRTTLQHRDYDGSVEYSAEDKMLHGRVLGIRDMISYGGTSIRELDRNFRDAIDDYIASCEKRGKQPNIPYKGSFNVRVAMELHQRAARYAEEHRIALNAVVQKALSEYLAHVEEPSWPKSSTAPSAAKKSRSTPPKSRSARTAAA
jgi:predicted HicB family RNase H-like nuclease